MGAGRVLDAIECRWMAAALRFVAVALNVPLAHVLTWGIGPFPAPGLLGAGVGSLPAAALVHLVRSPSLASCRNPPSVPGPAECPMRDGLPPAIGHTNEGAAHAVVGSMPGLSGAAAPSADQIVRSVDGPLYCSPWARTPPVTVRARGVRRRRGAPPARRRKGCNRHGPGLDARRHRGAVKGRWGHRTRPPEEPRRDRPRRGHVRHRHDHRDG